MGKNVIIQALWEIQLEEHTKEQLKKIEHEEMQEQIIAQAVMK